MNWTIDPDGLGLYCQSVGEGSVLILIPGFSSGIWSWGWQAELTNKIRLITYDPRGIGRSRPADKMQLAGQSITTFVSDVLSVLDALKIEKVSILGASFGGFVAQQFALRHPDRVEKLILACTSAGGKEHVRPDIAILRSFTRDPDRPLGEQIRRFFRPAFTEKFTAENAEILEQVWWRLDAALDLEMVRWSAMLGALEALENGTTVIVDHHESPNAIEGSLDVIAEACTEVGVRSVLAYGITDRHGPDGARRGLAENERFVRAGGRGLVGIHAAFTCTDASLEAAAGLAEDLGVGVHVHVCEGLGDADAPRRQAGLTRDDWLLAHSVHLPTDHALRGTILHNPMSNLNNAVGYANPARFSNRVALGTDGIGGNVLEAFRLAYVLQRSVDVTCGPGTAWSWLDAGWDLVPEAREDEVTWSYDPMDPWHVAFTPGIRPLRVVVGGEVVFADGQPTRVDADEIRAKAREQAARLHARL